MQKKRNKEKPVLIFWAAVQHPCAPSISSHNLKFKRMGAENSSPENSHENSTEKCIRMEDDAFEACIKSGGDASKCFREGERAFDACTGVSSGDAPSDSDAPSGEDKSGDNPVTRSGGERNNKPQQVSHVPSDSFTILIRIIDGVHNNKEHRLHVRPSTTVAELKNQVHGLTQHPTDRIRLWWRVYLEVDSRTLQSYNIQRENIVRRECRIFGELYTPNK